ncbi:hypothetical protein A4G16_08725 [Mannheimia granulomatis]|uniref:Type II secretory pathway, pseudopilin n=1 Tax=Mannheimia granulomatis TaxID=85402 RepID=A0A6G8JJR7_9PAST|nr:DUF5374 domain-containing protein [Mannheimia granulomatis]QIM67442.1 hypothetical protein A4G16_08725 [Mannheimia granulomatis]
MNKYKAETTISLLVAISLFAVIVLVFSQWQSVQNRLLNKQFQQQQAVQILENQIALKLARLECESSLTQNSVYYQIQCSSNQQSVRFPLGKIELNND